MRLRTDEALEKCRETSDDSMTPGYQKLDHVGKDGMQKEEIMHRFPGL